MGDHMDGKQLPMACFSALIAVFDSPVPWT